MSDELEKFLQELGAKQTDAVAEIVQLARELSLGVHKGLWTRQLRSVRGFSSSALRDFLQYRWGGVDGFDHYVERLSGHGFIEIEHVQTGYTWTRNIRLSNHSFDLLTDVAPFNVFVSYRHRESSAFALLVVARLKQEGMRAYCDMRLIPGDPYHPELEDQVRACEFLVLLLGPSTLCSPAVLKEVQWGICSNAKIVPVTHNGFEFKREAWESKVSSGVLDKIDYNHRISIPKEHESAAGYDIAIRTLLTNRFGVTP